MHTTSVFSARRRVPADSMNQHRTAFPILALEVVRISDVILEVLDARFIEETRNHELEREIREAGKKLVFVVNKADLVDLRTVKQKLDASGLKPYVFFSCTKAIGRGKLMECIKIEAKRAKSTHAKTHVGVVGYPNTGKSSLINFLSGRKASSTSAAAGHTKGIQRIRFNKDISILDTPGVIAENTAAIGSAAGVKKHTMIGVRMYDHLKDPDLAVSTIMREHPGIVEKYYEIDANGDAEVLLDILGKKYNFLVKGGATDTMRAARLVMKAWQEGRIRVNGKKE